MSYCFGRVASNAGTAAANRIEPGHQPGMARAPFAFVAEIEIAERAGERQVAVVRACSPSRWRLLQMVEGPVDLALLAFHPGRVPLVLGPEALLVDEQQRRIQDAVAERAQRQRLDAFHAALGKQHRRWRQAVEVLADHVAVEDGRAAVDHQRGDFRRADWAD